MVLEADGTVHGDRERWERCYRARDNDGTDVRLGMM